MQKSLSKNTKKKPAKLGNPMAIMAATNAAKGIPPLGWVAIALGLGFIVYKMSGIFSVVGSAGNAVSTVLDSTSSGINKVFESLGLKDVPDKEIAQKFMQTSVYKQAFNPQYWLVLINNGQNKNMKTNIDLAKSYSKKLYDAINVIKTNDEDAVYAVLNAMPTHADLSYVCYIFNAMYGKDLYQWICKGMWADGEMRKCIAIVCAKSPQ